MAKVIGRVLKPQPQYKATCDKCGAVILFDENEIQNRYQYNEYAFSIGTCPKCNNNVSFDKQRAKVKVDKPVKCEDVNCEHFKNGECSYQGTDWKECPLS